MKICPQCQNVFPDDYIFCMSDGTTLINENEQEQETIVQEKIITPGGTSALSEDMLVVCLKCNLANRVASRFCKKCGNPLGSSEMPVNQPFPLLEQNNSSDSSPNDFPPQNPNPQGVSALNFGNKLIFIIAGLIGCVILLMAVILAMKFGGSSEVANANTNVSEANEVFETIDNNSTISNTENVAPPIEEKQVKPKEKSDANSNIVNSDMEISNANIVASNSNTASSSGGSAVALTNIVVRESPSPNSGKVAVFFRNSKMQILDTERSETGTIWYRVRVTEYGCNAKDSTICGKDDYYDSEEGWVYSNNVSVR